MAKQNAVASDEIEFGDPPPEARSTQQESPQQTETRLTTIQQSPVLQVDAGIAQQLAMARPRDVRVAARKALNELEAFPEFAEKAYYVIPYDDGETVVEGPSIKAATALARAWGNNTSGWLLTGETEDRVQLMGFFFDLETNTRTFRTLSVSKLAWSRKKKQTYRLRDDRLNVAIQAGGSKVVRNSILAGLPEGLVAGYKNRAKQIVAAGVGGKGKKPIPAGERLERAYAYFKALGVEKEELNAYLSGQPEIQSVEDKISHLIGLYNAIKEGQIDVEEVFKGPEGPVAPAAGGPSQATMDDLMGGGTKPPEVR